jgi:hypothetical protein
MKANRKFLSSLSLFLLTACLVMSLASCEGLTNLFPKEDGKTTPVTESTTSDPYEGVEWIDTTNIFIPGELKSTKTIMGEYNKELYDSSTRFQGKEYSTRRYDVLATALDFDKIYSASVVSVDDDWKRCELLVAGQKYNFTTHFVETETELQMFLANPNTDKTVKIEMLEEAETYIIFQIIYESGETEQVTLSNPYYDLSMMKAMAMLFPIAFEGEFDIEYTKEVVKYRYHSVTKEFVEED